MSYHHSVKRHKPFKIFLILLQKVSHITHSGGNKMNSQGPSSRAAKDPASTTASILLLLFLLSSFLSFSLPSLPPLVPSSLSPEYFKANTTHPLFLPEKTEYVSGIVFFNSHNVTAYNKRVIPCYKTFGTGHLSPPAQKNYRDYLSESQFKQGSHTKLVYYLYFL